MVEIFKTAIENETQAELVIALLKKHYAAYAANFDLEDCDRILRIEADRIPVNSVIRLLKAEGYFVELLD